MIRKGKEEEKKVSATKPPRTRESERERKGMMWQCDALQCDDAWEHFARDVSLWVEKKTSTEGVGSSFIELTFYFGCSAGK